MSASGRVPYHQLRLEDHLYACPPRFFNPLDKQFPRTFPNFPRRLPDRREGGIEGIGPDHIIKSDHGNIARYLKSLFMDCF